jgi:hypothetical protein
MQKNSRPVGVGDQPFTVPTRPCETIATQAVVKLPGRDAPQYARVGDVDPLDLVAGRMLGEQGPESLHVRQLRHDPRPRARRCDLGGG